MEWYKYGCKEIQPDLFADDFIDILQELRPVGCLHKRIGSQFHIFTPV